MDLRRTLRFASLAALLAAAPSAAPTDLTQTYSYDALGRLVRVDYSNGTALVYEYDVAGNLTRSEVVTAETVLDAVIDFDAAGEVAGAVLAATSASAGDTTVGPILVAGHRPSQPSVNSAVVFDSAQPTGGDADLGTPHASFGGPGVGDAGAAGAPFENAQPLGNLLVVAEDLLDADGDGLVDDPDDASEPGTTLTFDFTTLAAPFVPSRITVTSLTTVDLEPSPTPATARFYDATGALVGTVPLAPAGDNGVRHHPLGNHTGVARMELELGQSCGLAELRFRAHE